MRWEHPTLGNVPPFRFIGVAEEMGSIDRLTEFAIDEACAALSRLRPKHHDREEFYMSVNISGKDVVRDGFVDYVAHTLDRHDLDGCALRLELTETALIEGPDLAARQLTQLRKLGCGISIDDFGTGYSNLAYLKKLPLTVLKIDRAFAGDAHKNAVSRSIVRMLVGLALEMKVDVVAEGLETPDDVDTMLQLGCRYGQGYYFSKPIPEATLLDLIVSSNLRNLRSA